MQPTVTNVRLEKKQKKYPHVQPTLANVRLEIKKKQKKTPARATNPCQGASCRCR